VAALHTLRRDADRPTPTEAHLITGFAAIWRLNQVHLCGRISALVNTPKRLVAVHEKSYLIKLLNRIYSIVSIQRAGFI
jgi:hypothetical protein